MGDAGLEPDGGRPHTCRRPQPLWPFPSFPIIRSWAPHPLELPYRLKALRATPKAKCMMAYETDERLKSYLDKLIEFTKGEFRGEPASETFSVLCKQQQELENRVKCAAFREGRQEKQESPYREEHRARRTQSSVRIQFPSVNTAQ